MTPPRAIAASALIALLAYLPALRNDFVWDDRNLLAENALFARPDAVRRAFQQDFWASVDNAAPSSYYRPAVLVTFAADRRLYGSRAAGYHATNLILHAIVAALASVLLLGWRVNPWVAFGAAALFAAHPLAAESVAWISGRTDVLATLFLLATLWCDTHRRSLGWRLAAVGCFAAALASKESALVAPLLLVTFARWRGETARRAAAARWELGAVVVLYAAARHAALGNFVARDAPLQGAVAMGIRVLEVLHTAGVLAWPARCRLEYGTSVTAADLVPGALAGGVVLCLAGAVLFGRHRDRKSPAAAWCAAGLWCLLPGAASIALVGIAADRLAYLPGVFLVPAAVTEIARRLPRRAAWCVVALLIVSAGAMSWRRALTWRSDLAFWQAAAAEVHPAPPVQLNLGAAYHRTGWLVEAVQALQRVATGPQQSQAQYLLGLVYTEAGCEDRAVGHYRNAIAADPAYFAPVNNLTTLLMERGRAVEAEQVLIAALASAGAARPALEDKLRRVRAVRARGQATVDSLASCGDDATATALLRDPNYLEQLGRARLQARNFDQARVLFEAVLHLDPERTSARAALAQCGPHGIDRR